MLQCHWQTSPASVVLGSLRGSSTLLENNVSRVNSFIADHLAGGSYPRVNLLELDDVCLEGQRVTAILDARRLRTGAEPS